MRVAVFNLHAGVDGWGRPTRALEETVNLGADLLILPETWRGDNGPDFFEELKTSLQMDGIFAPLAHCERITTGKGGASWQPLSAHLTGEHGLYFQEHRDLKPAQAARRQKLGALEPGTWGLSVLTKFAIESIRVEELERLPREKVRRSLIVATLRDGDQRFHVLGVHGAHISHGSAKQYRRINEIAAGLEPGIPVLIGGDFNCWRPLLRRFLPGWKTLVRARTWPARFPHSQIDHIMGRGAWLSRGGQAYNFGSDHRALVCDLEIGN